MVKITIGDKRLEFPERIQLDKWKRMVKYDFEDPDQWAQILATLLDEDVELIKRCEFQSLTLAIAFTVTLINNRKTWKCRDFNTLTLGEFIDLDVYALQSIEKNIDVMIEMIGEPTEWADEALWLIEQYNQFRTHTYRQYSVLFGLNDKGSEDEEDEEDWDPNRVMRSWYKIIISLAEGSLLNIDAVTDQPYKKAFNFMAWKKEKQQEENFKQLQQQRNYDVSRSRK